MTWDGNGTHDGVIASKLVGREQMRDTGGREKRGQDPAHRGANAVIVHGVSAPASFDAIRDFGAMLRQAMPSALCSVFASAFDSRTLVAPCLPQPPGTGRKISGSASDQHALLFRP